MNRKRTQRSDTFPPQVSSNTRAVLLDVGDAVGLVGPGPVRVQVQVPGVQVPVREGHEPPAHGEQQPAAHEGGGEDDEREAPAQVHQRGEHVLQEAALLADVLVREVARTVFGDEARLVHAVPEHRLTGQPGGEARETELLRDDALPRQHLGEERKKKWNQTSFWGLQCVFTRGWNMSACTRRGRGRGGGLQARGLAPFCGHEEDVVRLLSSRGLVHTSRARTRFRGTFRDPRKTPNAPKLFSVALNKVFLNKFP